jgi:hypothetical protein
VTAAPEVTPHAQELQPLNCGNERHPDETPEEHNAVFESTQVPPRH